MIPKWLRITNFRSFRETQCFTFPQGKGFYFLTGDNREEPRLEANGAGKSSLWDALFWVLFAKTSRGLKAGDVSNWDINSGTVVEFAYEHDDLEWIVQRTWNPNAWTLFASDGTSEALAPDDTSNVLLAHLGIDFDAFQHSCIMGQGCPMFLDLKAADKEALFAKVMNLDQWLGHSDEASRLAAAALFEIDRLTTKLNASKGALAENALGDYSDDIARWNDERDHDVQVSNDLHKQQSAELAGLRNNRGAVVRSVATLEQRLSIGNMKRQTLLSEYNSKKAATDLLDGVLHSITTDIQVADSQATALQVSQCPNCLQPISIEYRYRQNTNLEIRRRGLATALKNINGSIEVGNQQIHDLNESIDLLDRDNDEVAGAHRDAERDLRRIDDRIEVLNRELDAIEKSVAALLEKANPFEVRQTQQASRAVQLADDIAECQQAIDSKTEHLRRLQYWVRGFKELRLYLIAEAIYQLEIEVNSSLTQVGLMNWKLQFDVDRENKSGKIQRGFAVKVLSPHNKIAVPWEAWSGGESQRLRIAAEMGLSNLIRTSRSVQFPMEVWDEPTNWMSPQGVSDLLDALACRARDQQRQIWIVDHRSLGYGAFNDVYTVIKDSTGSRLK